MKIVFLNTWHGKLQAELRQFIVGHKPDTDVFCFQEADGAMTALLSEELADYQLASTSKQLNERDQFTQATLVKRGIDIVSSSPLLTEAMDCGAGLYTELRAGSASLHLMNFHGIAYVEDDKLDTPARLKQARFLLDGLANKSGLKIVGGDFNLSPSTQSIQLFEASGYLNLITDYKIKTTRNELAWDLYPGKKQYYADYVFTSQDVEVTSFSVPAAKVSDHLPMILEVDI